MIRRYTQRGILAGGLILVGAAFATTPAQAQSLSGTWTVTSEGRGGTVSRTLVLAQEGSTLTGTMTFALGGRRGGGGGGGPQTLQISDGSVEGSSFSFSMTFDVQGSSITQRYSGIFEGDTMQGQIEGGRGGAQPFTGTRGG